MALIAGDRHGGLTDIVKIDGKMVNFHSKFRKPGTEHVSRHLENQKSDKLAV
jgi:hypothetical protein